MRLFKIIIIFSFLSNFSFSQTKVDNSYIQPLDEYLGLLKTKDFESASNFIYPKLFEYYPVKMLFKLFTELSIDSNIIVDIYDTKVLNKSEFLRQGNKKYMLVSYVCNYKITLKNYSKPTDEYTMDSLEMYYELYKIKFGADNTTIDKNKNVIFITEVRKLILIKDPAYQFWKLLEYNSRTKMIIDIFVPLEVFKLLKV